MALEAFALAALAQSSMLVGGLVVYGYRFSAKTIGWLAAFGAAALISAVSFDLIPEGAALTTLQSGLLLLAGAAVFLLADRFVESRFGGEDSGSPLGS